MVPWTMNWKTWNSVGGDDATPEIEDVLSQDRFLL